MELQSSIAQVASYRAAWDEVEVAAEASADLAEREGLVGKLCYPLRAARRARLARGPLGRRASSGAAARTSWPSRSAGRRSSFAALYWLGRTLRDSGDHTAAVTELDRALDVCERAGLIAQSIEAMSARAITLAMAGKGEQGRETAEEAGHLAERLHYPVGQAAALMAKGTTADDPDEATAHADARRASCGRASAARSTPRSRTCCSGHTLRETGARTRRAPRSSARRPSSSGSASRTSPTGPRRSSEGPAS